MADTIPRLACRVTSLDELRSLWERDLLRQRVMVGDDPSVPVLAPVVLDVVLADRVLTSLPGRAVFRVPGPAAGLGLELDPPPPAARAAVEQALGAASGDACAEPSPPSPLRHEQLDELPEAVVLLEEDGVGSESEPDSPVPHPDETIRPSGGSDTARPIALRYKELTAPEKMKVALRGDRDARIQVMKEGSPQLLKYLLQNPQTTAQEVAHVASNLGTALDVLKFIADHPVHGQHESVRVALVQNPRTPIPLVRQHIDKLPRRVLAKLAKSEHVRAEVQRLARKIILTKRA